MPRKLDNKDNKYAVTITEMKEYVYIVEAESYNEASDSAMSEHVLGYSTGTADEVHTIESGVSVKCIETAEDRYEAQCEFERECKEDR